MNLSVESQQACIAEVPLQKKLEQWIKITLEAVHHQQHCGLTIRFVEAQESQQLNLDYRQKDKSTNVLSFPFEPPKGLDDVEINNYLGDLVICAEVVITEANQQNKSLEAHWAHMCVHGCLHLLGFDHITTEDAASMEQLEIDILSKLSMPNPYIETVKD